MTQPTGTVFGIDLGTTYSCISYIDNTGAAMVATNLDGERSTPSVVNFGEGDTVIVGQVAKDMAVVEPDRTVQFVKTLMGDTNVAITVDGVEKCPEEVSSYILRKVAKDAQVTTGFDVENVVITVPAYFGNDKRAATKAAGELAGLNVLNIVQEPVAAAVYYGCTKNETDQTVLVYDLGGGTFDVTVINISAYGKDIKVVCSDGNHNLGGRLWDQAIVQYLADAFCDETGFDGEYDQFAMQAFQSAAEKTKKQLSQRESVKVPLNVAGIPAQIQLTRDEFESLTAHLLDETMNLTSKVAENAQSKGYKVDKILLVGGSTYMPQVSCALATMFPTLPIELNDPNEAVAKGAALSALSMAVNIIKEEQASQNDCTPQNSDCANNGEGVTCTPIISLPAAVDLDSIAATNFILATTKSYGIQVHVSGIEDRLMISNLIKKNVEMPSSEPYSVEKRFCTSEAGQTSISIKIFENDEEQDIIEIDGRKPILEGSFDLGQAYPAESPIDVTFSLNVDGLLSILAVEPSSGKEFPMEIETSCLSKEQIKQIKSTALSVAIE